MLNYTVGLRTVKNLILTALAPVGNTMYIYGGGWNEEDNGGCREARSIGLAKEWAEFAACCDSTYSYRDYDRGRDISLIHKGLDCSAYVGWVIYNVLNDGRDYVTRSTDVGNMLEQRGLGYVKAAGDGTKQRAGDIMYGADDNNRHTYISLGTCEDGSVLLLHSSPNGVQISGTATPSGCKGSRAIALATEYMRRCYPRWYSRYPNNGRGAEYLTQYNRFCWTALKDEEGCRGMSAEEVVRAVLEGEVNSCLCD